MQSAPAVVEDNQVVGETQTDVTDDDIPLLIEVYTGDPAQLIPHEGRQEKVDALLRELRPFIHIEVKKVVLQESVRLEQVLAKQLEADLIKTLRERLISSD